ncbi:PilZ domain-containing protein [Acidobacteria bacterium AH-259-D05]|nr:PilZ domain-containing protein [Acidobacteria bacterium AH-259-D05]
MNERRTENPGDFFEVERVVAISPLGKSNVELAATIRKNTPGETVLELTKPTVPPFFKKGERARVKYWDEKGLYYSELEILEVSGSDYQYVVLSRHGEGMTVQRRKSSRIPASIPLSFVVVDAEKTKLIGKTVGDSKTRDISVGGLRFETHLPLKVEDRLIVQLNMSPKKVSAFGWVVRANRIERDGKYINSISVEFLQLEGREQDQLLQFLAQLSGE